MFRSHTHAVPALWGMVIAGLTAAPSSTPPAWGPSAEGVWQTSAGESVYYACYGEGSPVIVIEAGDSASQEYGRIFLEPLAERTTTCVYDRLGHGASDAPLAPVRTPDDLGAVLEGLLAGTDLPAPYLLVGQSLGGNLQIDFAAHHADEVAGLVLIEAYHDDPEGMAAWQAEEGFEWTDNPDHVHLLDATIRLDELPLPFGEFPVLVITATDADEGNVENQAYWLDISPDSEQVVLEGSHNLHFDAPDAVTELILGLLDRISEPAESDGPAASAATPLAEGGQLVFSRVGAGYGEATLFVADLATGAEQLLLEYGDVECCPWASRDGSRVVFAYLTADEQIFPGAIDVDGSNYRIFDPPAAGLNLGAGPFTPDGTRIAFEGFHPTDDSAAGIYLGSAVDGSELVRLTDHPDIACDFSPDGSQLVFLRLDPADPDPRRGSLMIVNVDGSDLRELAPAGTVVRYCARWSPDGSRIAFTDPDGSLWLSDPDGSNVSEIFHGGADSGWVLNPAWSPSGNRLAYTVNSGPEPWAHPVNHIVIVDADGSNPVVVIDSEDHKRDLSWVPAAEAPSDGDLLPEGIYRTGEATRDELIATGVAAGFDADEVEEFVEADGIEHAAEVGLRLANGALTMSLAYDGGPDQVGWRATYEVVDGGTFIATEPCGSTEFHYNVAGDQVSVDVDTDQVVRDWADNPPECAAAPEGLIAQTIFWEAAPFARVPDQDATESSVAADPAAVYASTSFVVPFEVTLPDWVDPTPAVTEANFVTWEATAADRGIRFLAPVNVYPPGEPTTAPLPDDYTSYLLSQVDHGAIFDDIVETIVDGHPATVLTATVDASLDGGLGCQAEGLAAEVCFGLQPDLSLRLAVIEVGDQPLLIWVRDIRGVDAEYDTFDVMLASLRFLDTSDAGAQDADTVPTSEPLGSPDTAEADGLNYVAFGDSWPEGAHCGGCTTFVGLWAQAIEASTGRDVALTDFTGQAEPSAPPGKTSASLLAALQTDERARDAVRAADIILIATGPNELDVLGETCDGPDDFDCVRDLGETWAENFDAILTEIDLLREGAPTVIRLVNAANLFVMVPEAIPDDAADDFATAGPGALTFELLTTAICDAAEAHSAVCIDVRPLITGPNLDQPGDENSPESMQAITDALVAAGLPEVELPEGASGLRARFAGDTDAPLGYYEYLPPGYGDGDPRPLLVFLEGVEEHGDGSESELDRLLATGVPEQLASGAWPVERPFVVLAPQHAPPADEEPYEGCFETPELATGCFRVQTELGHPEGGSGCHTPTEVHDFIAYALDAYDVDPDRVYLTGLSCGAYAAYEYAAEHGASQIAAMVPIAGEGRFAWDRAGCGLGDVAVWAFHGDADDVVPTDGSIEPMTSLADCADAKENMLTIYPGVDHDSWTRTYDLSAGHDIYEWLLHHGRSGG